MIERIDAGTLYPERRLYLDYIAGRGTASSFFTHPIAGFAQALEARSRVDYPRGAICDRLYEYNTRFASDPAVLASITDLRARSTFCVISGQQVGFLGGPVYTTYKIITTIRLAASLEERLGVRVVPLFWLADEDHDFTEINHAYVLKRDGEVGAIRFEWEGRGRPIADLPLSDEICSVFGEYFDVLLPGPHHALTRELFAPKKGEDYSGWHARLCAQFFSKQGLVLVGPSLLRASGRVFFRTALKRRPEIQDCLERTAERLRAAGYSPALSPAQAGGLYTFDAAGRRVRVGDPRSHLLTVDEHPERYSPDVALRPLLADALLPILASVLGPGEITYHAMLKPLYSLFDLPQPICFPRKGFTVLTRTEAELVSRFGTSVEAILSGTFTSKEALRARAPHEVRERFAEAREAIGKDLEPLRTTVTDLDPTLERSWAGTRAVSLQAIDRLERRALRAGLAKHGLSLGAFQRLRNSLLPRKRPQERVFPLPHFINRHGPGFVDRLLSLTELDNHYHRVVTWEDDD